MGMNFKHQGTVDCRQNIEMPGFSILVNPKLVWNSWNLACYHGVASTCRGTNFVPFGAGLGICFSQTRASHNKHDGFGRERATFGTKRYPLPLIALKFFSCVNIEQQECCVNFCDFSGFVWTFLCINWVFNAFMCIIQIWTTCTCSTAYKLVEKSNLCPWVHAYVPLKKWEWISNTLPPSLGRKHWDTRFLNSSKSKTTLKFMKLGKLSWSGINMSW